MRVYACVCVCSRLQYNRISLAIITTRFAFLRTLKCFPFFYHDVYHDVSLPKCLPNLVSSCSRAVDAVEKSGSLDCVTREREPTATRHSDTPRWSSKLDSIMKSTFTFIFTLALCNGWVPSNSTSELERKKLLKHSLQRCGRITHQYVVLIDGKVVQ